MKTKSKALILALCAVLLVTASVLGTMAYLTSTDEVKNTFTVGSVAIKLDEAKVDEAGQPIAGAARVQANSYKLLPGHTYTKDPTIHVDANSEDCYLFVKVKNEIRPIEKKGVGSVTAGVEFNMIPNGWALVKDLDNETAVYVYVGKTVGTTGPAIVQAGANVDVFKELAIDGSVDNDTLAQYKDKTITVTAYAVQKDGFENMTPAEIWAATFGKA